MIEMVHIDETVSIHTDDDAATSGILSLPKGSKRNTTGVILAHGAGNNMNAPLLAAFSEGLAESGYPVLRFNFMYAEKGRKAPDRSGILENTWLAAFEFFKNRLGADLVSCVAAGKSMGGRIASQMAAQGRLPVDRLIFLGYPLHPAGDKEKVRDAHLYRINVPMLYFAGTSDPLCNMTLLQGVLGRLRATWDLYAIEGGYHSFHVPKSTGLTDEVVYERVVAKTLEWLRRA